MSTSDEAITMRVRPSELQKLYVIEFLEQHPCLATGRGFTGLTADRMRDKRELWLELTDKLNNMGHAFKTVDTWQKYWRDQRAFVRERHAAYMKSCKNGNRGLRNCVKPLNDYEKRVLALITPITSTETDQSNYFVIEYVDSDNDDQIKAKVESDNEHSQLGGASFALSSSSFDQVSPPKDEPISVPTSPMPPSTPTPPPQSSSAPSIQIKSIRSLLSEDQNERNGKRLRLDTELERKTIALLEKNEEFNREMEIKKLEVEKEKVQALKELISVVRLGFACIAGQNMKSN